MQKVRKFKESIKKDAKNMAAVGGIIGAMAGLTGGALLGSKSGSISALGGALGGAIGAGGFGVSGGALSGAVGSSVGYYPGRGIASLVLSKEEQKERQRKKKKELSKRKNSSLLKCKKIRIFMQEKQVNSQIDKQQLPSEEIKITKIEAPQEPDNSKAVEVGPSYYTGFRDIAEMLRIFMTGGIAFIVFIIVLFWKDITSIFG